MPLQAKNNFILLTQYKKDLDGLVIPAGETSETKYKVHSVGEEVSSCKPDDIIIAWVDSQPIKVDGTDYWVTKGEDIIAVVENE